MANSKPVAMVYNGIMNYNTAVSFMSLQKTYNIRLK
jgi:hypothetical protein